AIDHDARVREALLVAAHVGVRDVLVLVDALVHRAPLRRRSGGAEREQGGNGNAHGRDSTAPALRACRAAGFAPEEYFWERICTTCVARIPCVTSTGGIDHDAHAAFEGLRTPFLS